MDDQKRVLVSGAGSGIGRAIAKELAATGAAIILLGRKHEGLKQTLGMLERKTDHTILQADIRDAARIRQALEGASLTHLDGVVANAGVGGENHYGVGDRWTEIIETNLTGTYNLVNECLPYLMKRKDRYRHIVIMSSILARLGVLNHTGYCASKSGLLGLMRSWAMEHATNKILVNALCPGWVTTNMATEGMEAYARQSGKNYDEVQADQMAHVPLRKMGTPEEIAALVKFLLSESQTSITGQVFDINNGAIMVP